MLAGAAVTGTSSKLDAQMAGSTPGVVPGAPPRGISTWPGHLTTWPLVPSMSILTAEFPDIQVEAARY